MTVRNLGIFNRRIDAEIESVYFVKQLFTITQNHMNVVKLMYSKPIFLYQDQYKTYSLKYLVVIDGEHYASENKPEQEVDKVAPMLIISPPRILEDFLTKNCSRQIEPWENKLDENTTVPCLAFNLNDQTSKSPVEYAKLFVEYSELSINKIALIRGFLTGCYQKFQKIGTETGDKVRPGPVCEGADGKIQIDFIIQIAPTPITEAQFNIEAANKLLALAKEHNLNDSAVIGFKGTIGCPCVRIQIDKKDLSNFKAYMDEIPNAVLSPDQGRSYCATPQ